MSIGVCLEAVCLRRVKLILRIFWQKKKLTTKKFLYPMESRLWNRVLGSLLMNTSIAYEYRLTLNTLIFVLFIRRVNARLVPKDLNLLSKRRRAEVAKEGLDNIAEDPTFIKRIITGDETWVYEYDVETVQQSSEWRPKNEPKPYRLFEKFLPSN